MKFEGADGTVIEDEVFDAPDSGRRTWAMYNLDQIHYRLRARLDELRARQGQMAGVPVAPRTRSSNNTTAGSWSLFQKVFDEEFADKFKEGGHHL